VAAVAFCQAEFYVSKEFMGKNYGKTRDYGNRRTADPAFQKENLLNLT